MALTDLVLAIDQGTTSVRASVLDAQLRVVASAAEPILRTFPHPGWVELDAEEVVRATERVAAAAFRQSGADAKALCAMGLTNQGETVLLWERGTGRPLAPAIVWQCRRTERACARLRSEGNESWVKKATGLPLDPYFSATKLAWLLDHVPGARERAARGEILAGTLDAYTLYRLSSGQKHVTDPSTACRTLLARLVDGRFDDRLCELFDVPKGLLPEVVPSDTDLGVVQVGGISTRVRAILCDQPAALLGTGCLVPGEGKCTYGTGAFVQINLGANASVEEDGLLRSVAWQIGGVTTYLLEGNVLAAGDAFTWLRDEMGMIVSFGDIDDVLRRIPTTGGVVFVPALAGLGAPRWIGDARGTILGLSRGSRREHVIRAALEGVAHQVADVVDVAARVCPERLAPLWADGGLAVSDPFLQLQADLLGLPLRRARATEATTLGVAALAATSAGAVDSLAAAVAPGESTSFVPQLDERARQRARARHGSAIALMTTAAALELTQTGEEDATS